MSRPPRFDLPGIPQHIVQRGNNRLPCFLDDVDRERYRRGLQEAALRYDCAIHAYVLMNNHIHLLVTPNTSGAVSRFMQTAGRNYAGYFNARHRRSGTLWEGRYKACLVDTEQYVLRCYRYIELNPVRARMTTDPARFRWSSHSANGLGACDPLVTPHAEYLRLGSDPASRLTAYRALFAEVLSDALVDEIRAYLQQQRALGSHAFRTRVEATTRRFAGVRPAHRPRGKSL